MTTELSILLGCLGDPRTGVRLGHESGRWTLAAGERDSYEVLCHHEDWTEFARLAREYSDFTQGEN